MPNQKSPLPFASLDTLIQRAPAYARLHGRISQLATSGYVLALQLNEFFRPELAYSSFPHAWFKYYTEQDFFPCDPVLQWAATHCETARWSEIAATVTAPKSLKVLELAASYNLRFGMLSSMKNLMAGLNRSFLSCARADREFTDDELRELEEIFLDILSLRSLTLSLTPSCREVLALLADGLSQADIALKLGIDRSSVKKRIDRARKALGARSSHNAVARAVRASMVGAFD